MTPAQLAQLKAAINANPVWAAYPMTDDGYIDLARALNEVASPSFFVWASDVDVQLVKQAVEWAKLTPASAPDASQAWFNRQAQCLGKQFNLNMLLPITGPLNATLPNIRAGLQDALTGIYSTAAGTAQGAGWQAVRDTLSRPATWAERALADTNAGNGAARATPATMTHEGALTAADVRDARNS